MKNSKRLKSLQALAYSVFFIMAFAIVFATGCSKDKDEDPIDEDPKPDPLEAQVRVQVAYDASNVAFKFVWKSQSKTLPQAAGNTGKIYPGQYHDMLIHDGTQFNRTPADERMQEDRISFMIDKHTQGIPGFATGTCAASCHTDMERHHLLSDNILDHWHWRGQRSGPMGYAEDAAVNNEERIRDNAGTSPTKFIRSGGDRLRENQDALAGEGHAVLEDGLPRFVFNKGKNMPGSFTIPSYFLFDGSNNIITNPHTQISNTTDVSQNRSLLVIHQDTDFDTEQKVNAIDLAYLVYVALSSVDHLPEHLQDEGSADFSYWKNYWADQTGIADNAESQAVTKLNEVHQEWLDSDKKALIGRSVGFIYSSDQHDITSTHSFDASRNEWSVTMYRHLSTGSEFDANLAGLPTGEKYAFAFAMHDLGGAGISHQISQSYVISNTDETDIQAKNVSNVFEVDWNEIPWLDTYYVKDEYVLNWKWTEDWLRGGSHPGAASFETNTCASCHENKLIYSSVQN